jgi:LmbE family N-acetylglucosaminyl deacetylase
MIDSDRFKKILILAPHTDDGEFGCGGTISRLIQSGAEVHYIVFSICEESVPLGFPKDILKTELEMATKILGFERKNVHTLTYPVRNFNLHRQNILEDLIQYRQVIKPDLVLMPSLNDIHQDHKVVAEEGLRAFKNQSIWSYELVWNLISFDQTCFVELSEEHINLKINAIQAYESQLGRRYSSPEFIKSQAAVRGVQSGNLFAEVFEVVRMNINI